jgi:tRNA threonylcarbamoyl adenosine modification protein YeaZ
MNQSSVEGTSARIVLALETSSRTYAVAVGDGETPLAQAAAHRSDPECPQLGVLVDGVLARGGLPFSDIGVIGVDVGPGGLVPIREAVAYANGLAFSLGVKIFPMSSLELMAVAAHGACRGPFLCLKAARGGNTYVGLFAHGETAEMRHGPPGSVIPAIASGLTRVCVAGPIKEDVPDLLPDVTVEDSGLEEADVAVLYRVTRAAAADPERLVPVASPINEASRIFHEPASIRRTRRS